MCSIHTVFMYPHVLLQNSWTQGHIRRWILQLERRLWLVIQYLKAAHINTHTHYQMQTLSLTHTHIYTHKHTHTHTNTLTRLCNCPPGIIRFINSPIAFPLSGVCLSVTHGCLSSGPQGCLSVFRTTGLPVCIQDNMAVCLSSGPQCCLSSGPQGWMSVFRTTGCSP